MTKISKIDKINIELVNGKIRLRWTFKGERLSLSIGNSSEENLEIAKAKAYQINSDIVLERFNPDDYRKKKIIVPQPSVKSEIRLIDLWEIFLKEMISSGLKDTTIAVYLELDRIIQKLGDGLSYDAFDVKERLQKITSVGQTKAVLRKLSSCCEHGIKRKLVKENNFKDVWEYLPDTPLKEAYCFSDGELKLILDNFAVHSGHKTYHDLIVFLLNTGCRPSEGLGVRWGDLNDDLTEITFRGSPQRIDGQGIKWMEGSKNFKKGRRCKAKTRTIPLNKTLRLNLEQRAMKGGFEAKDLIFPNSVNKFIDYSNFSKVWEECVQSLEGFCDRIIYNCRDTFITKQLIAGVPIAIIAAWCDNSPSVIEARYADYIRLAVNGVTPVDI
jgi:integrase